MNYVEFLRVRKAFFIYAAIVAFLVLTIVVSIHGAHSHAWPGAHITIDTGDAASGSRARAMLSQGSAPIPLGLLLGIAGYFSAAFATVVAASLNRENERAGFVFTKPVSRTRLALSYIGVDAVAIVAAYAYAFVVFCIAPLASLGLLRTIFVDPQAPAIAFLGLGISFLWYGVLQAVSAGYRGRGGTFVGLSWIVFIGLVVLAPLSALGPIFHGVVMLLNLVNPFAYFSGLSSNSKLGGIEVSSVFNLSVELRAAITWCIAAAGCAVAILAWKRVEA